MNASEPQAPQPDALSSLLSRLTSGLRQSASIYNQSAKEPVRVSLLKSEHSGLTFSLTIDGRGFRFRHTGTNFVQVDKVDGDSAETHARIHPDADPDNGHSAWREEQLWRGGREILRRETDLVDAYFMAAVRQKLLA